MSELSVGSLSGLAANSYVIDVASGSQLTQTGMVLQVVSTTKTDTFSSALASGGDSVPITGLSASITPSSTSSKILVNVTVTGATSNSNIYGSLAFRVMRGATRLAPADVSNRPGVTTANVQQTTYGVSIGSITLEQLDSPSTTSSITYSVEAVNATAGAATVYVNRSGTDGDTADSFRAYSTITLIEVAG